MNIAGLPVLFSPVFKPRESWSNMGISSKQFVPENFAENNSFNPDYLIKGFTKKEWKSINFEYASYQL